MATHNGTLDTVNRTITHKGDIAWNTGSLTWADYTQWCQYTLTTTAAETGANGTPLRYQTAIIDLGSSKSVTPYVEYDAEGTVRVVIEHHTSSSDLSSSTFLGKYTTDNAIDTAITTYSVLDYYEEGMTDEESSAAHNYTSFTARYVRITVYVENFATATTRGVPVLNKFYYELRTDSILEELNDIATSGLSGTVEARVLAFNDIGVATNIQLTAHSEANKKLVPQIVSKTNKTVRVLDANTFDTAAVEATIDVVARGLPGTLTATPTRIEQA